MHKTKLLSLKIIYLLILICSYFSAQAEEEKRIKKGVVFGGFPAVSFDSDLGLEYGFLAKLYFFGDGSRYPLYNHAVALEAAKNTKGGALVHVCYDSDKFIKNIRTTFDFVYDHEMLAYFYGFNGYNSVYSDSLENHNRAFYRYDNQTFRLKLDFQDNFGETHWGWIAGFNLLHFNPSSVNIEKINADKTNIINKLPNEPELYDKYVQWGIISQEETEANWINYLKFGVKYDTRNNRFNPSSGIFTEMMLQTAPKFLLNTFPHTKLAIIHRQYIPIVKKKMTFAYRFFYQTTLGNSHVPFYAQPLLINSFESSSSTQGLGGGRSLRGVMRNSVLGDGFFMTNAEIRTKLFQTKMFRQFFDFGLNFFIDTGCITKEIDIVDLSSQLTEAEQSLYFSNGKQQFHTSGGMGIKAIMNDNFIISLDLGKPFDKRDGDDIKMYINMNYMF